MSKAKKPNWIPCLGSINNRCKVKLNANASNPFDGYCMDCRELQDTDKKDGDIIEDEVRSIVALALLDGQNQIHDLNAKKETAKTIEERMHKAVDYHSKKITDLLARQDKASYDKGFKDAKRVFQKMVSLDQEIKALNPKDQ